MATTILHTWGVEWHPKYPKKKTRINKPDNFPLFLIFIFWHITLNKKKHERRWDFLDFISHLKLPFVQFFALSWISIYFFISFGYIYFIYSSLLFGCDGVKLYDGGKLLYSLFMLNAFWVSKSSSFFWGWWWGNIQKH